ncbi:MAG: SDR family NAD(P)-dependent oxidoreductase [Ilumatobacter sp.]|uniref:SDR family NAD(P)-dependent oxidoreductase n=1 Tax=Ilumatobacter sp. TaxID=1967498 RepID=UPI00391AD198
MGDLDGQTAFVSGASRGIGRAIATAYAADGAHVIAAARNEQLLRDVVASIKSAGGSAEALVMDVADHTSVRSGFDHIARSRLDIAVLNAGVFVEPRSVATSDLDDWRHCLNVNLLGVVDCARSAIPLLIERGGKIIAIGSGTGYQAHPGLGPYAAAKAALASLIRTLAVELRSSNIAVNELIPGPVDTSDSGNDTDTTALADAESDWFKRPDDVTDLALLLARFPNNGPSGQTFSLMGRTL